MSKLLTCRLASALVQWTIYLQVNHLWELQYSQEPSSHYMDSQEFPQPARGPYTSGNHIYVSKVVLINKIIYKRNATENLHCTYEQCSSTTGWWWCHWCPVHEHAPLKSPLRNRSNSTTRSTYTDTKVSISCWPSARPAS